jgi:hypothetical protein
MSRETLAPVLAFSTASIPTLENGGRRPFGALSVRYWTGNHAGLLGTWKSMKPIAPILIAAFLAAVFALDVVRVFSYSRFPISDYKSFITLGLVVLAAAVFRHLDEVPARVGIRLVCTGYSRLAILCRRTHRDAGCRSRSASDDPHRVERPHIRHVGRVSCRLTLPDLATSHTKIVSL